MVWFVFRLILIQVAVFRWLIFADNFLYIVDDLIEESYMISDLKFTREIVNIFNSLAITLS